MSFVHGKNTAVVAGANDWTGWSNSLEVSADVDTAETSVFGQDWKTHVPGQAGGTATVGGLYVTDTPLPDHDGPFVGTVGMDGLESGQLARLVPVATTNFGHTSPVADIVAFSWAWIATEEIGFGVVLANGDVATATTMPIIDLGAGTTDQDLILHLHVLALDDPELEIAVEHSASSDMSGAAEITGSDVIFDDTGAARVLIPSVATLNRYLRVALTFDGGGNETATIVVAMAHRPEN